MSFLAISNGNSSTDLIKIKEGEVWQIDKYTMTFQNSDEIRTKNAAAYRLFLERYPSGRRGAIRLFKPSSHHIGEYHEWTVLYKKHYVAFAKIIQDVSFMRMLVRRSNSFFSRYDYHEITYHPERLKVHMNRYCQNLKKKDQEETNEKGGGKNFYTFMREVLYQYTEYQKQYPGCPSIDTIYQQVMEEKAKSKKKEVVSPNVEKLPDIPLSSPVGEKDPDIVLFDQMDVPIEGKEDPLRDFLYGGDHAHRWTSMFEQEYLFLLGNYDFTDRSFQSYQKWITLLEEVFSGNVSCPTIGYDMKAKNHFSEALIVIFLVHQRNTWLEREIQLALENKSHVAILLQDNHLLPFYQQRYPQATTIDADGYSNDDTLPGYSGLSDFLLGVYRDYQRKKYQKK